jgi:DNA primase
MIPPVKINQAKKFPITAILDYFGHSAVLEKNNGELVYFSPFRNERTPSFYVNPKKNGFQDFGDDEKKGDAISLYRFLTGKSFLTAIFELTENKINVSQTEHVQYVPLREKEQGIEIIAIRDEISNPRLSLYAESRGISIEVLSTYCSEVQYRQKNGKIYASIGFKNDAGGIELRSAGFKSCHGKKGITTIQGNSELLLFEGFFDFLSFRQMHPSLKGRSAVILNSLSLLKSVPYDNYSKVFHFLNNDEAGEKAKKRIQMYHKNTEDWSKIYFAYNDLNESLQAQTKREHDQKQAI